MIDPPLHGPNQSRSPSAGPRLAANSRETLQSETSACMWMVDKEKKHPQKQPSDKKQELIRTLDGFYCYIPKKFWKILIRNSERQHNIIIFLQIFDCNGSVPCRKGIVRPLFEYRNVHLRSSDLWESRLQITKYWAQKLYKINFGRYFDVMRLHQLHQNIPRNLICNIKIRWYFRGPLETYFWALLVLLFNNFWDFEFCSSFPASQNTQVTSARGNQTHSVGEEAGEPHSRHPRGKRNLSGQLPPTSSGTQLQPLQLHLRSFRPMRSYGSISFKAQLGEPFLGILIFFFVSSVFHFSSYLFISFIVLSFFHGLVARGMAIFQCPKSTGIPETFSRKSDSHQISFSEFWIFRARKNAAPYPQPFHIPLDSLLYRRNRDVHAIFCPQNLGGVFRCSRMSGRRTSGTSRPSLGAQSLALFFFSFPRENRGSKMSGKTGSPRHPSPRHPRPA